MKVQDGKHYLQLSGFWGIDSVRLLELKLGFMTSTWLTPEGQGLESRDQKADLGNRAHFIDMYNSQWLHCRRRI